MAPLYVMFSCVFVTFPYFILGQMWYLIVSIPDLCHLPYFTLNNIVFDKSRVMLNDMLVEYIVEVGSVIKLWGLLWSFP